MFLKPTSDLSLVKSMFNGSGMRKLCNSGEDISKGLSDSMIDHMSSRSDVEFLEVVENSDCLGVIMINRLYRSIWEIHLALRTSGDATKSAVRMALDELKDRGATEVRAVYPKSRRSLDKLAAFFGFGDFVDFDGMVSFRVLNIA